MESRLKNCAHNLHYDSTLYVKLISYASWKS